MAERMVDALDEAIGATEKEIFNEAIDAKTPAESDGDRSLEAMGTGLEGQLEDEDGEATSDEADATEGEVQGEGEQPRDDKGRFAAEKPEPQAKTEPKEARGQQAGDEPAARVP